MKESPRGSYGVRLVRGPFVRLPPNPSVCHDVDELPALCASLAGPLATDLFCGAGGLSLGLAEAGYHVVLAVDHDDEALETHRAHHPGLSVNWDMHDPAVVERVAQLVVENGIELIAGGPPCQPFSRAGRSMIRDLVRSGRRERHDRRRDLWESFLAVIEMAQPPAVLMENVPDMALDRSMVILRTIVERLEQLGYTVEERVVETWRYGVPQFRQRLILVALRDGLRFDWPAESAERVSVDAAIGDLPGVEGGWRPSNGDGPDPVASGWAAYGGPKTAFQKRARRSVSRSHADRIYDHITRPVRPDDAIAFAQMDHATRYSDLDPSLRRYRHDIFDDKYKRLDPDDLSRTITAHIAKDGYWYIHPYEDRTLTIREAARIQTFSDDIRFAGPPSASFRQIGNAVPPALGEAFGTAIRASIEASTQTPMPSTAEVSATLARWFDSNPPVKVPWLEAENRWLVIQGELLWGRITAELLRPAWASIRRLKTPELTLAKLDTLGRIAAGWGRSARVEELRSAAEWFVANPKALEPDAPVTDLASAPGVTQAVADLACRVVPGDHDDPVLIGYGVLRVAARFQRDVDPNQNRLSDGRLAVARMIGGEDVSHSAHLALIELANGICGTGAPECERCPLLKWCDYAAERDSIPQLLPYEG